MTEVTLKPCPFCGGEVEPKFDYYTGVSQKHHFWQCKRDPNHRGGVGCYNMAPCKSQPSAQRGSCDKCQAENRPCIFSIAAWNTRAEAIEARGGRIVWEGE